MTNYTHNVEQLLKKGEQPDLNRLSPEFKTHPTIDDLKYLSEYFETSIDALIKNPKIADMKEALDNIKLIILDVDGVLTDGGMFYSESGDEYKKFNTKDGMGIKERAKRGYNFGIISSGINTTLVKRRGEMLGIQRIFVGKKEKLPILQGWCSDMKISLNQVAYIGDDINDLGVIAEVGFSACPADAIDMIKSNVNVILTKKGGEGCVREWLDIYFPIKLT